MFERLSTDAGPAPARHSGRMKRLPLLIFSAALATPALAPVATFAEPLPVSDEAIVSIGGKLYQKHCADCHGADGRGGAVTGAAQTVEAPDLTGLAARRDGEFPFWELYEQISGSELMPAHATRHMPIWGQELAVDAGERDAEIARGRILALMAYLATLQTP